MPTSHTPPVQERYVNPYTDFGFKKLFGTDMNKELLISFLNALLQKDGQNIVDLTYLNSEHLGSYSGERKAIFDVYCENDRGEKFIVEMQNVYQQFFKDRSVFYSTFPIREQAMRGDWNFELTAVYTVGILNFIFDEDRDFPECYHHRVMLMDVDHKHVFYDKLTFIYLEMPKFLKTEAELDSMFDKWLFVIKNLSRLLERPVALQERVFEHMFRAAEIARFSPQELSEYEDSVKAYRDINNAIVTAKKEGMEEGMAKGIEEGMAKGLEKGLEEGKHLQSLEIARNLQTLGYPIKDIASITGLSIQEIENL